MDLFQCVEARFEIKNIDALLRPIRRWKGFDQRRKITAVSGIASRGQ